MTDRCVEAPPRVEDVAASHPVSEWASHYPISYAGCPDIATAREPPMGICFQAFIFYLLAAGLYVGKDSIWEIS